MDDGVGELGFGQLARDTGTATASAPHSVAVAGIYNARTELPPDALRPPSQVDVRDGLDDLPWRPDHFVGRDDELDRLDGVLSRPGAVLVQAVHGLGGIGKSTLAAHWAATREHGRRPVRWFTADSPAGVQQGLADLAVALQPALKVLPVDALAEWGVQWLASHTGWLVVLDNVNDPAHIAPLLSRAPGGRFLITSRLGDGWGGNVALVRLDVLAPDESLDLITSIITSKGPRDLNGAAELCEELGHLPLAVEQAGAYIAQTPFMTPRNYLQLLAEHPAEMYEQAGATTPDERTVARVWTITLDHIASRQPLAVDLLRILAWYAPEAIPAFLAALPEGRAVQTNQALGLLTAYSMITPDPATETIAVHRLVQALARTPHPTNPHRASNLINQARESATANLDAALPQRWGDPVTWPRCRALLPHFDALSQHADPATDTPTTARIHNEIGLYIKDQGLVARAIHILQRAYTGYERILGDSDPSTLTSRNNLANAYEAVGDPTRAITLHEQNLEDRVRILGPDHPNTLVTRNNLASAYQAAGDPARAVALHEQNLEDRIRLLGNDHPDVLTTRNNLAGAYEDVGDPGRAITLHEQNLEDRNRILGSNHPDTLSSRNNLAGAYVNARDPRRAIPLMEQTLDDYVRILGPDHPSTLTSRNNLASAYQAIGESARAITLHEQNFKDRVRILGPDHPDTLITHNNLAGAYVNARDLRRAIPLMQRTLDASARILGPDHPNTLTTRNNLAFAHRLMGDLDHAVTLLHESLALCLERFGADHPLTRKAQRVYSLAWEKRAVSGPKLEFGRAATGHKGGCL
ncbi:tetratricopeptide repeat protein [Streptomyces bauhiniae]|uniref:tetratricopeptide repeat protein n=1 Tax=Streptomyces bauhiniae TaxID=2340725 RepID=UPI00142E94BB|nr:tetratricopeptide repeat protein [Streptomyces bauhiniae]